MHLTREECDKLGIDWATGRLKPTAGPPAKGPGVPATPSPARPPAIPPSPAPGPQGRSQGHRIELPGVMPPPLNALMRGKLKDRIRLGKRWRAEVAFAVRAQAIPEAAGKRAVSIVVTLPPGRRAIDPDALYKATGDALVDCRRLRGDSHLWVRWESVRFFRGADLHTSLVLTDLPPESSP